MKKNIVLVAALGVVLVGCATSGKLFEAAHTVAEAGPAVVEDTQTLWEKIDALKDRIVAIFDKGTNAPVVK
jgi:hypothetical protein